MKHRIHRGVSNDSLDKALEAHYRHAAFASSVANEDQIQRELDDITMRTAAIKSSDPVSLVLPAKPKTPLLRRAWFVPMLLAPSVVLGAVFSHRFPGIAVGICVTISSMSLAMVMIAEIIAVHHLGRHWGRLYEVLFHAIWHYGKPDISSDKKGADSPSESPLASS